MMLDPEKTYVCGIDAARMGQDSSVIVVIELGDADKKISHRIVFIKEIKKNTMDALYEYVLWLHGKFNFQSIWVDSSGLGAGLSDFLIKELNSTKHQKFQKPGYNFKYRKTDIVKGVTFTLKSKMDMYSHLKILMERGMLKIPNHKKLIWEMSSFEYELTTGGQMKLHHPDTQGAHDDLCDALALAAQGTRQDTPGGVVWLS